MDSPARSHICFHFRSCLQYTTASGAQEANTASDGRPCGPRLGLCCRVSSSRRVRDLLSLWRLLLSPAIYGVSNSGDGMLSLPFLPLCLSSSSCLHFSFTRAVPEMKPRSEKWLRR